MGQSNGGEPRAGRARAPVGLLLLAATTTVCLAFASPASGRPGDLDPSYGDHGFADWSGVGAVLGVGTGYPTLDGAGRLLTLGRTSAPAFGRSTTVQRTTPAGTPDPTFGDGGFVTVAERGWHGAGLAVQPDGRIVVLVSEGGCGPCETRLYRLLSDGQRDPTLDGVEVPMEAKRNDANLLVDPSGRILVPADAGVFGLTPDGAVDPGFGDAGVVPIADGLEALERYPTGGYLAGAMRPHPPDVGANITKFDGDGVSDPGWGSDGTASVGRPGRSDGDEGFELAAGPGGRVAVGGYEVGSRPSPPLSWLFVLDAEGDLDPGFDPEPALTLPVPPQPGAAVNIGGLAWDDAGRLLMTGNGTDWSRPFEPRPDTAFIARLGDDGSRDASFAEDGLGPFPQQYSTFPSSSLGSILVQPDGRILAEAAPTVARFLAAPGGTADADADGVPDADDACPRRSAEHRDGCQRTDVAIELDYRERRLQGRVDAPGVCRTDAEGGPRTVLLLRREQGEDETVDRTELDGRRFEFRRKPRGNRFYAQLEEMLQPGVVVCRAARSPAAPPRLRLELEAPKQKPTRRLRARARCEGLGCKLRGRAVVKLRRPGRKNLKLRSRRVTERLAAGERERLTFKLERRDARKLKRSIRNSGKARKRSRVVFEARARKAGQSDRAREKSRLRRG